MLRFLLSAILTLLLLPMLLGLMRRATGGSGRRAGSGERDEDGSKRAGRPPGAGASGAGDPLGLDRSTAIDVPYTELGRDGDPAAQEQEPADGGAGARRNRP